MLLHKEHRDADFSNRISPKRESMVSAESIPEISTLNDTLSHSRLVSTNKLFLLGSQIFFLVLQCSIVVCYNWFDRSYIMFTKNGITSFLKFCRCIPTVADVRQFRDGFYLNRPHSYASDFSNFLDIDQLSSSCNSCDGESSER